MLFSDAKRKTSVCVSIILQREDNIRRSDVKIESLCMPCLDRHSLGALVDDSG